MTPLLLKKVLLAAMIGVIAATSICFYFASTFLRNTALETARTKADITLMKEDIEKLKRLETEMKEKSEIVERAALIVGDSTSFQHQNQIVEDVNAYAKLVGVEIGGFSFAPDGPAGGPSGSSTASSGTTTAIPDVKTLNATVTLKTPIQYDNFLRFLEAIEQNLTKMQVTGVNMSPATDDPNLINNPTIGLLIYVKK